MTDQNDNIAASPNPADERRAQLAALIPEAFSEGRLDVSVNHAAFFSPTHGPGQ
jgi:hypothetical protein